MIRNKFLILVIAIILILIISFWIILTERDAMEETEREETGEQGRTSNALTNVETILYNNEDTARWEINSGEFFRYQDEDVVDLLELEIDVIDMTQKTETRLYTFNSPEGEYNNEKARLSLEGPVEIEKDQLLFTVGFLEWLQTENLVRGKKGVEIESPEIILRGDRFESDSSLESIKVSGNKEKRAHLYWKGNENEK